VLLVQGPGPAVVSRISPSRWQGPEQIGREPTLTAEQLVLTSAPAAVAKTRE
jgi:hypothetical protein